MSFEHVFTFIVSVDYMKIFKTLSPCGWTVNLYRGSCSFHFIVFCVCVCSPNWLSCVHISLFYHNKKDCEKYQILLFSRLQTSASRRSCAAQNNKTITNKTRALVLTTKSNRETTHKTCASFWLMSTTLVRHNTQFWRKLDTTSVYVCLVLSQIKEYNNCDMQNIKHQTYTSYRNHSCSSLIKNQMNVSLADLVRHV